MDYDITYNTFNIITPHLSSKPLIIFGPHITKNQSLESTYLSEYQLLTKNNLKNHDNYFSSLDLPELSESDSFSNTLKSKQLFLSHNWGTDNLNRNNHKRVKIISNYLKKNGYTVWLDEEQIIGGNIDSSMMDGINNSECVIIFVTEKYIDKINNGCNSMEYRTDNCYKEFNYANITKKKLIPILMEPIPKLLEKKGLFNFYLGNHLYIDFSKDLNKKFLEKNMKRMVRSLRSNNIFPDNNLNDEENKLKNGSKKLISYLKLYKSKS